MEISDLLEEIVYGLEDVAQKTHRLEKYPEDCSNNQLLEALDEIEEGIRSVYKHVKRLRRKVNED